MNFIHIVLFHAKVYSKNSYFLTLLFSSTVSFILIEYTLSYMNESSLISNVWISGAVFGLWNICITSAGMINFQKWQRTLMYLLNNKVSDITSLIALLIAPATFGLLSFPISYILCKIIGIPLSDITPYTVLAIFFLYIGCIILSLLISSIFLLTKNAIVYEKLLVVPILIVAGLLALPPQFDKIISLLGYIIPINAPISFLVYNNNDFIVKSIISITISLIIVYFLFRKIIVIAKNKGLLEVM